MNSTLFLLFEGKLNLPGRFAVLWRFAIFLEEVQNFGWSIGSEGLLA
jgi:hypothetical protein